MQTIVELPEYQRQSERLLTNAEHTALVNYLAAHPTAGDIMQGTGGIRKIRWAVTGRGKSGGARVVYYYHNQVMPLFLLTAFGKGTKDNLTKAERNELAKFTEYLIQQYGGRHE